MKQLNAEESFTEWRSRFSDLPKSWLKEIKDEPLSDKESFANDYGRLPDDFPKEYWNYYKQGFKVGGENRDLLYANLITRVNEFINDIVPNLMIAKGIEKWKSYFQIALKRIKNHTD